MGAVTSEHTDRATIPTYAALAAIVELCCVPARSLARSSTIDYYAITQ